jgi:DNA ligase-1
LGWRSLADAPRPAAGPPRLTVAEADAAFEAAQAESGPGSQARRRDLLHQLLARATEPEQRLLAGLVTGELRQGAQRGVLAEAVAMAAAVPAPTVRRAVTLSGDLVQTAVAALTGGSEALAAFGLQVGRPLAPMLAQSAPDVAAALERTGPAALEWKLDGIRLQVHRDGDAVRVWTRSLDDITARVPEVVATVRELDAAALVADGEVIALEPAELARGRPLPFQVTSARVARHASATGEPRPLTTVLFDVLHLDGTDVLDEPATARREALEQVAPHLAVPRHVVADPTDPAETAAAERFSADALARGHEGVVVKALDAPYAMGRRGGAWVKVKPRTTYDLVVLAAEWGHGRRTGLLSNLHLGARDPEGRYGEPGGFVMLGKTFKGMTDDMLRWQTVRMQALATRSARGQVDVRPELVVEIAVDGVQTSPRYPAGMALRFARVLRHRPDKRAAEADTIEEVAKLHMAR